MVVRQISKCWWRVGTGEVPPMIDSHDVRQARLLVVKAFDHTDYY